MRRVLAVLAALVLLPMAYTPRAAAAGPTTLTAQQLSDAFNAYGDTSGAWNGGDSTASVALPDGRVVWLFSDSFIGAVNSDGSRPAGQPMIHNSMIVQQDGALTETRTGGTLAEPLSLVGTSTDVDPADAGHWVADGTVEGTTLQVLYNHYHRSGSSPLDVRLVGTDLASFDLPSLTLRSLTTLPVSTRIAWGSAILEDSGTTYIYGAGMADDLGPIKPVYLAKVPAGGISGPWQFWTGSGWSAAEADAASLMSGVGTAFAVQRVGSQYVLVTVDGNLVFNSDVVAYTASSPAGPFTGPVPLFRAPEPQPGKQIIVYDARLHPEWAASGKLLVSYNVNSLDPADNAASASLYRPRFVDVTWPPPAPSGVPAAPTGLTATADTSGTVHLAWTATTGATGYRVYSRDVSQGQSHFVRLPNTVSTATFDATNLADGHLFEFAVAAVNANGEGSRSGTATAVARTSAGQPGTFQSASAGSAISGAYIVDLKDNAAKGEGGMAAIAARLVATYGGTLEHVFAAVLGGFSVTGMTDAQAHAMAADPAVASVEETRAATLYAGSDGGVQNAPPSWGLDRIDGTRDGKYVYPSTGQGARIYVLDSGVRATNQDFGGRASLFSSQWNDPTDNSCKSHGTMVAGIAGGSGYGVAKKATILDVQVGCVGANWSFASITAGVNSIVRNGTPGSVINMSLGGPPNSATDALKQAVLDAIGKGFTVVGAVPNANMDACNDVPGGIPQVITVSSVDVNDTRPADRAWGSCVDLFAPGENITSASNLGDDQSRTSSGTSFATPHVAGAAALILAAHPTYSPADVQQALIGIAQPGVVQNAGTGSPNLLLRVDAPLPDAPTNLTATAAADGTIGLSWQPVTATGDISYLVSQRDVTAGEAFFRWTNPIRSGTTATATDLVPDHTYEFTVAAANTMAVSPESNVATATAFQLPPGAPTGLTATANHNGTITLNWAAPQPDVWFWVYQRDVTLNETDFTKLPLPVTVCCTMDAGYLMNGHEYEYEVSAINSAGEGPPSNIASAVATFDAPQPPTNLRATPGDGQATLTWDQVPGDVWYLVYQRDATQNGTWQQLPLPITSCCTMTAGYLTNGDTYEFKVTATNQAESIASNVVSVRPLPPMPTAPQNLHATPLNSGDIKLTWDPLPIDVYYWVYYRDVTAGQTTFTKGAYPTDQTTATWGLLTNGHVYEFKITAENMAGEGPASVPVQARSTVALPAAPQNLYAVANNNLQIFLNWDAPDSASYYYWVYWRDVTAGQTTFSKGAYPTDKTNATWGMLTDNHVYEFKVTAQNAAGEGPASATARATASGTVPNPPSNLAASAGDGSVRLTWTASPTPSVGYFVYFRDTTTGQSWQRSPYPVMSCCSYTVSMLTNGHTYEFKLTAGNSVGESGFTNVVSARPLPPFPQAPSNLRATAGDGQVTLAWTASSTAGVYYWIEYRVSGGTWQRLKYPISTCCTFTVGYLVNGTTYDFRVRATNVAGDSDPSNVDSAQPMPPFPQPPSGLSASAGDGKVSLSWHASPTSGVYYIIEYRKAGTSAWQRLKYPVTTCCSFTVTYLANGTTYDFRVRATNLSGDSDPTNTDSARPMPPFPKPPSNLRATPSDHQVKLTWTASPTSDVYYYIYQRNYSRNGSWQRLFYPVLATSFTAGYLDNGDTYQFKVTAFNLSGESGPSNIAIATPRYADGTSRYTEVTSSWILNNYGDFSAVQRYDVTGTVRGTRDGDYIRVDGSWHLNNGKQLLDGIFWYVLVDCSEGYSVAHQTLEYPTGTSASGGGLIYYFKMNPNSMYKVTVWGGGAVTYSGMIYGRYNISAPSGIVPFVAETPCF